MDKYEVSIKQYNLFLKAIKMQIPDEEYAQLLPNSSSLQYIENANTYYGMPLHPKYGKHPVYDNYPVVGISYEAAKKYCEWLTSQTENFDGAKIYYRLLSEKEWDNLSNGERFILKKRFTKQSILINSDILDSLNVKGKTYSTNYNVANKIKFIANRKIYTIKRQQPNKFYEPQLQPSSTLDNIMNERGVYHLFDNVSEMTETRGIAKGANFLTNQNQNFKIKIPYCKPEAWLGFRVVKVVKTAD